MSGVKNLNLPPRICENLERAGLVSAHSLVVLSESELRKVANLSQEECEIVYDIASEAVLTPGFVTGLDAERVLAQRWQHVSVGCALMDKFLGGGIAVRGITELAGESGSGKTQLCLQMCLTVQYPRKAGGLGAGAVYICTEDVFPSRRLRQLIKSFPPRMENSREVKVDFEENIFIEHIADAEGLKKCLFVQLPQLLTKHEVGLIVIDSIAGVFRADFEPQDAVNRAKELRAVGGQLHRLAESFHVAVVCVNQHYSTMRSGLADIMLIKKYSPDLTDQLMAVGYVVRCKQWRYFHRAVKKWPSYMVTAMVSSEQTVAALGLAWANMVTTRLQMSRTGAHVPHGDNLLAVRSLQVVFSPNLPPGTCHFVVTAEGVSAV